MHQFRNLGIVIFFSRLACRACLIYVRDMHNISGGVFKFILMYFMQFTAENISRK